MGYGSRKEMAWLADQGRIVLDGHALKDVGARITLSPDLPSRLLIDDAPLDPLPGMILMLHKPLGVTCSHKEAGRLVYDLLPSRWRSRTPALSTVGRLDKETSGLLLITDDGALLHKIISPKHHVAKTYLATLEEPLKGHEADLFASGTLMLDDDEKPLLPAELTVLSPTSARLVLHEGRYHQVRRMFAAVGNHVTALHRDKIGGLALPDTLPAGDVKLLTEAEIALIFS
jgi:16S rRNA pseudouridine516 synthase